MAGILAVALNPTIDISCDTAHVQPTRKTRTVNQRHHPGGGGVNVARVIAELGGRADLAYLSGGATGALLDGLLADRDIGLRRFSMNGSVRVAFMVYEEQTGCEYRFVPEGPNVSDGELAALLAHVSDFDGEFVVASGSLPAGTAPDTYARMAESTGRKGGKFILDTSGDALRATLEQSSVFLVKPSIGELEKLSGSALDERSARDAALELVKKGVAKYVALTMGREGALLAGPDGVVRISPVHVVARSAVGAGDSFVGAMVWSMARGDSMPEAFRWGAAAGAAAVMTAGTELCRRDDVVALHASMD